MVLSEYFSVQSILSLKTEIYNVKTDFRDYFDNIYLNV